MKRVFAALMITALLTSASFADFEFTNSATENGYTGHTANFDEMGVPTGVSMDPFTFYQASDGLTFTSNSGFLVADDWDTLAGIDGGESVGTNQLAGGFGVRFNFDQDVSELSWQGWADGSGLPFGGTGIVAFNDGVEVANFIGVFGVPFGGVGDEWFNFVATNGDSFDEVVFFNGAFNSFTTYVDNVSFNDAGVVPEPGTIGLLAIVGLAVLRRKR